MRVFDVVGPVMVGPSSSHTAGACRIGLMARAVLGETPVRAHIRLHGSFAATGRGHGTDRAIVAGLLGMPPSDSRLREALAWAEAQSLTVTFESVDLGSHVHPNTAQIHLEGTRGGVAEVIASSVGGGHAEVLDVDGFPVRFDLVRPTLLVFHRDAPGAVADVARVLADVRTNIAAMEVGRRARGGEALMVIETDAPVLAWALTAIHGLPEVIQVRNVDVNGTLA